MLRASHLPRAATPALAGALKLSLIPTLGFLPLSSSSSSASTVVRLSSTFAPSSHSVLPKTLTPNSSLLLPYSGFKRVPAMAGHLCPRATGSFSSASSSGDAREILVQHLLVKADDQRLLLDLQKRIAEGDELSFLAAKYSICPSKEEGGMLGWVRKGQMVPEFEEAAFNAPVNKVVRCKTKFGWHLLQVLSERDEAILQDIEANELHDKMQDPCFIEQAQLIDVREPDEVARASLPGFQVLPLRQFGSWGPEVATNLDPQKDTYVLCHHGMRSLQVAKWLQTQGFRRVFNISGGIHAYAVKADPSVPTY